MKRLILFTMIVLLAPRFAAAVDAVYRLEYVIRGGANSRFLLLFPLRVYYEASAAVDLTVSAREDGSTLFTYVQVPRVAYVFRTLGFSGKTVALLTVNGNEEGTQAFADDIVSRWRLQAPEFAARIKTVKKFAHRLLMSEQPPFVFERDLSGFYRNFRVGLETRYRYHPARTGIDFDVFPMLAELANLFNHRFVPDLTSVSVGRFPAEWQGGDLDFSAELNRVIGLLGKAVESHVTVEQKFPFRMRFRVASSDGEAIEICGEAFPDVPVWKGFMIREVTRRVRFRPVTHEFVSDEIEIAIRNAKGQGGFGRLLLKRIDSKEDDR